MRAIVKGGDDYLQCLADTSHLIMRRAYCWQHASYSSSRIKRFYSNRQYFGHRYLVV